MSDAKRFKGVGPAWMNPAKMALAFTLVGVGTAGLVWCVVEEQQEDDSDYDTQTDQVLQSHGYHPIASHYGYYGTPGGREVSRPTAIAEVGAVDPGAFRGVRVSRGGFGHFSFRSGGS